ncbi:MAG: FGGY family carbohydrate kinase [Candidatus Jordarchaeales archaeon]
MGREEAIAVFDVGTTGVRALLFNLEGSILGGAYEEYPTISEHPGQSEQVPDVWWEASCRTIQSALKNAHVSPSDVVAVSVCTQRATIFPVDKSGRPLYRALTWMDTRMSPSAKKLKKVIGQRESLNKVLWIKDNVPSVFEQTFKFLFVDSYFYFKLAGVFVSDLSNAFYGPFDVEKLSWNEKLADEVGVPLDKWVEVYPSGKVVGEVTVEAARETQLKAGTPVVVGGGDQQCSCVGVGAVRHGIVKVTTGTGTFVDALIDKPIYDPFGILFTLPHVLEGKWVVEGVIPGTGSILRWFRDNFGHLEKKVAEDVGVDAYSILEDEAETVSPGSDGLLVIPLFNFGKGAIYNLSFAHSRRHIIRAIMECNGFGIRGLLDIISGMGIAVEELRIDGGGARSKLWRQIQADVTGKRISVPCIEEAGALGAAILASKGVKLFPSVEKAVESMVKISEVREPRHENKRVYDEMHPVFMKLLLSSYSEITGQSQN